MFILINTDCSTDEFFRRIGVATAASKLYQDYMSDIKVCKGIGPEVFAEVWMMLNVEPDERNENEIISTFVNLLGASRG